MVHLSLSSKVNVKKYYFLEMIGSVLYHNIPSSKSDLNNKHRNTRVTVSHKFCGTYTLDN